MTNWTLETNHNRETGEVYSYGWRYTYPGTLSYSQKNFRSLEDALDWFAGLLAGPRCRECGGVINFEYEKNTRAKMEALSVCLQCLHWLKVYEKYERHGTLVINGHAYTVNPDLPASAPRDAAGFGGREHVIETMDGETIVTRNLWHNGQVPACFRLRLQDNARWVKCFGCGFKTTRDG